MKYAEDNGYQPAGLTRECYIDGIWNKESAEDWLTEVQLPVYCSAADKKGNQTCP